MIGSLPLEAVQAQASSNKPASFNVPPENAPSQAFDYQNAKSKLPLLNQVSPSSSPSNLGNLGAPGTSLGKNIRGSSPGSERVAPATNISESEGDSGIGPMNYGTFNHPFTTARVQTYNPADDPSDSYPYRASGKLFFQDGTSSFVCSASVIKQRLVVTAAHCVYDNVAKRSYTNFRFIPAYKNGAAPYGTWTPAQIWTMTGYRTGSTCQTNLVVCQDDIAVLVMRDNASTKIGNRVGWYGYTWNFPGYVTSALFGNKRVTQITQIGYPAGQDGGNLMLRNDSLGFLDAALKNNTIIGSLMTGGSSGGPWLQNFGQPVVNSALYTNGLYSAPNVVSGVTSWGYIGGGAAPKQLGASPFLSTNIKALVDSACASTIVGPGNCS